MTVNERLVLCAVRLRDYADDTAEFGEAEDAAELRYVANIFEGMTGLLEAAETLLEYRTPVPDCGSDYVVRSHVKALQEACERVHGAMAGGEGGE